MQLQHLLSARALTALRALLVTGVMISLRQTCTGTVQDQCRQLWHCTPRPCMLRRQCVVITVAPCPCAVIVLHRCATGLVTPVATRSAFESGCAQDWAHAVFACGPPARRTSSCSLERGRRQHAGRCPAACSEAGASTPSCGRPAACMAAPPAVCWASPGGARPGRQCAGASTLQGLRQRAPARSDGGQDSSSWEVRVAPWPCVLPLRVNMSATTRSRG